MGAGQALLGEPEEERTVPFFPDFALREAIVALLYLAVLLVIASLTDPPLEEVADPTAAGYIPRPEWYFLWLFQTLKYFKGPYEVAGTFVLPTVAIGILVAAPFLDLREPRPRPLLPRTRPVRLWPRIVGAGALATIALLTLAAVTSPTPVVQTGPQLSEVEAAGKALFDKMGCPSCHAIGGEGGTRGPDLTNFGAKPDARDRVLLHFRVGGVPGSFMPGYELSDAELSSLAAYLLSLKGGQG